MKIALSLLVVVSSLAFTGGGCLPDSQGGGVDWPKVAQCGPKVDDVVGAVSRILLADGVANILSDASAQELEALGVKYGTNAVACLIDLVRQQFAARGASASPEVIAASRRADAFLMGHGVRSFQRSGP